MKKKKIILIIIGILLIIMSIGLTIFKISYQENKITSNDSNIKYNTNESFAKNIETDSLTFSNIKCSYNGKVSLINYTIENKTNKKLHLNKYEILIKNKNGDILTNIEPNLDSDIESQSNFNITNEINIDLSDAYYIEVTNIEINDS